MAPAAGEAEVRAEAQRWSKAADEKLRKMFLQEARAACDDKVKAFVECSKAEGLMVIMRCREQNRAMNDCAQQLTDEKHWEEFRQRKIEEYVAQGKLAIDSRLGYMGPPK